MIATYNDFNRGDLAVINYSYEKDILVIVLEKDYESPDGQRWFSCFYLKEQRTKLVYCNNIIKLS